MSRNPTAKQLGAFLCALLAASTLCAQHSTPRFTLPETTYDYVTLLTAAGLPGIALPTRSDKDSESQSNARATLGRVLFYDRLLSRNGKKSCSSCHQQKHAFADGRKLSPGFRGRMTRRNSMAIVNLRFQDGPLFWDGRTKTLEDLVLMPIQDPIEMGMKLDDLVERLKQEPDYAELFEAAFGTQEVTSRYIALALAEFVRAIVSLRSQFDEGLAATGDVDKPFANFTPAENRGKSLFFGSSSSRRNSCAGCHTRRLPTWCGNAFFVNPVMLQSDACRNNGVDAGHRHDDPGLAEVTGKPEDQGKFRAPSLRNIELTGPYMHDGRFRTLRQVVQFYAGRVRLHPTLDPVLNHNHSRAGSGGWGGPSKPLTSAAFTGIVGPAPGFPMSLRDRVDLVAFLKTLTDRSLLVDPRLSDPFAR